MSYLFTPTLSFDELHLIATEVWLLPRYSRRSGAEGGNISLIVFDAASLLDAAAAVSVTALTIWSVRHKVVILIS